MAKRTSKNRSRFDIAKYLETAGVRRSIANYRKGQTIFSQGDDCTTVLYLQQGTVKLTIVSPAGKEAVIAILYPGDFFGEGYIAGQPRRVARAVAVQPASVLAINKKEMLRVIHAEHEFSDKFISHTC